MPDRANFNALKQPKRPTRLEKSPIAGVGTFKSVFKWPGGKFSVINDIANYMPYGERLIEPFVGGGSVFTNLRYPDSICADVNGELINAYRVIKNKPDTLLLRLIELFKSGNNHDQYMELRQKFNTNRETLPSVECAALFIYLNRHCYNGLMRYNLSGKFNVGFGDYKRPYLPIRELIHLAGKATSTRFIHCAFSDTIALAGIGDVIFCDPPYEPLPNTEGFTSYSSGRFTMSHQEALVTHLKAARERGARAVITNSSAPLIVELYRDNGLMVSPLLARRSISSKASTREYANDIIATL